jgi:ribose/xylose/arabinose/galactoside ABC-type transport system permease subunit
MTVEQLEHSSTGGGAPVRDEPREGPLRRSFGRIARSALLIALGLEIFIFWLFSADFLTVDNFLDIGVQSSIIGLVAVATAILLITGYIDLSVGSTLALAAVVCGLLLVDGASPLVAGLAGVGTGLAVGVFNGALVCYLGFSTIIVTLGSLTAIRGVAISASDTTPTGFGDTFAKLGNGSIVGVPVPIVIAGAAFLLAGLFLRYSVYGRHVYAIGVNKEAAFLSGISIRKIPFVLFAVTGIAAGLGGVMLASRIDAAPGGSIGNGFELDVLTAVLLGGVAFDGGRGKIFGVLLGVAFLAILQNGLTLLNVPSTTALIVKGGVLIAAAALEFASARSAR